MTKTLLSKLLRVNIHAPFVCVLACGSRRPCLLGVWSACMVWNRALIAAVY